MTEAIKALLEWRLLVVALVAFGVAPGVLLRAIVLAYPRGHERRSELVAELYAMPVMARPWWVAQQLETALFEGPPARFQARRAPFVVVSARGAISLSRDLLSPPISGPPMRRRLSVLVMVLVLAGVAVVARIVDVQAIEATRYRAFGLSQRLRTETLPARRGRITDRNGVILAGPAVLMAVWADPRLVLDPLRSAQALSPLLGIKESVLQDRLTAATDFVYLARHVSQAQADRVLSLKLYGISTKHEPALVYPFGHTALPLLGGVDIDDVGIAGLERQYQSLLVGKPGKRVIERDPAGRPIDRGVHFYRPAVNGSDLRLSIDISMQRYAETILTRAVAAAGSRSGIAGVVDPSTGEILSLANEVAPSTATDSSPPNLADAYALDLNRISQLAERLPCAEGDASSAATDGSRGLDSAEVPAYCSSRTGLNTLGALSAISVVAAGGTYAKPLLVREILAPNGHKISLGSPRRAALTSEAASALLSAFERHTVIGLGGSSTVALELNSGQSGTEGGAHPYAVAGFLTVGERQFAVIVVLDTGNPGLVSSSAGSAFDDVARYLLGSR